MLGALRGFHTERRIAARTTAARDVVLLLHLVRQRKERLEHVIGGVDVGLGDAVVADAGKAPLPVGSTKLGDEGLPITLKAGDVEGGNAGTH
ncbi:hypothetical protein D3C71_1407600 [compost metagenome]